MSPTTPDYALLRTFNIALALAPALTFLCALHDRVATQVRKAPPPEPTAGGGPSEAAAGEGEGGDSSNAGEGQIAIGKLRGEDYNFEFQGKAREGKMHFRLFMTQVGVKFSGWAWVGVKFTVGLAEFMV